MKKNDRIIITSGASGTLTPGTKGRLTHIDNDGSWWATFIVTDRKKDTRRQIQWCVDAPGMEYTHFSFSKEGALSEVDPWLDQYIWSVTENKTLEITPADLSVICKSIIEDIMEGIE